MEEMSLVPVFSGQFSEDATQLCNARDLHATLKVGRDFTSWIKGRIDECRFVEGQDYYSPDSGNIRRGRGKPRTDYHLTLDMAKHLAMMERNEIGDQVRRYFIKIEKEARAARQPSLPEINVRQLLLEGNCDPTVALPPELQEAINRQAWLMAHDAYELCRQHLARRVASSSEIGWPRRLNERRAREVIAQTTLDRALTHRYHNIAEGLLDLVTMFAKTSAVYRDEMIGQVKQFCR